MVYGVAFFRFRAVVPSAPTGACHVGPLPFGEAGRGYQMCCCDVRHVASYIAAYVLLRAETPFRPYVATCAPM